MIACISAGENFVNVWPSSLSISVYFDIGYPPLQDRRSNRPAVDTVTGGMSSLLVLQLPDWTGEHRRVGSLEVDLVPPRNNRVRLRSEQMADDGEPLEHGAGAEVIFGDFPA